MLRRVCIFCGSSTGVRPEYRAAAEEIAAEARSQQIDSLDQIQWAVLETSGKISFIEKGSS